MKRYFSIALATAIFLAGCKKMSDQPMDQLPIPELMSTETIDAFILQKLEAENKFEWSSASSQLIWSALQQSDNWLSVGYALAFRRLCTGK